MRNVGKKVIGMYSMKPTKTLVVFQPRLESGCIHDGLNTRDIVREIPVLGFLVEEVMQPIASIFYFILSLLSFAWGPFAIAAVVNTEFGGPKAIYDVALFLMLLRALGLTVFTLIMMLDYNHGTVSLLIKNNFTTVLIQLGSRLLYIFAAASYFPNSVCNAHLTSMFFTVLHAVFFDYLKVTHMLRFNKEGFENLYGPGALASQINNFSGFFLFAFEFARHFAIIKYIDEGTNEFEVVSGDFRLTNVAVMNASFTTSMILFARVLLITYFTDGKKFIVLTSKIIVEPHYKEN